MVSDLPQNMKLTHYIPLIWAGRSRTQDANVCSEAISFWVPLRDQKADGLHHPRVPQAQQHTSQAASWSWQFLNGFAVVILHQMLCHQLKGIYSWQDAMTQATTKPAYMQAHKNYGPLLTRLTHSEVTRGDRKELRLTAEKAAFHCTTGTRTQVPPARLSAIPALPCRLLPPAGRAAPVLPP